MKKITDQTINEAIDEMRKISSFLTEGLYVDNDSPFEPLVSNSKEKDNIQQQKPQFEDVSSVINQIRKLALNGISKFASNTDSNEYQFFKKIFLECDKAISNKQKDLNTNEN